MRADDSMGDRAFLWPQQKKIYFFLKTFFDWIAAVILLFLLWWVILICVIAIKIDDSSASPFYNSKRVGYRERIFSMYKLRTIRVDMSNTEVVLDDMLTKPGRFIRKYSLDELPQLVNILKGDMSFIGPRPLIQRYVPYYTDEEHMRHNVRPGITGLAQINGRAGLNWDKRFAIDVEYVNEMSLSRDIKIIVRTIGKVLSKADVLSGDSDEELVSFDEYRKLQMKTDLNRVKLDEK